MKLAPLFILPFFITVVSCQRFRDRANNFSIEFLYFTQAELGGHAAVSPYGAWNLLSILRILSSGDTKTQLEKALWLPLSLVEVMYGVIKLNITFDVSNEKVSIRNYMLMHQQLADDLPKFKNEVGILGVNLMQLDFKKSATAAMAANTIITDEGNKLSLNVPKLFKATEINPNGIVLANVNSFQKVWRNKFTEVNVEDFFDERFQAIGKVNMMYQRVVTKFTNMSPLLSQVLQLPYENDGKYSMLLILPNPKIKIEDVFEKLTKFRLDQILNILEILPNTPVDVKLPKFEINTNYALNVPLNEMGVFDLFDERYAKFYNVPQGVFASVLVQNVNMVVNETGISTAKLVKANRIAFLANRPFLYFVIENTSDAVFISGVYSKPKLY